MGCVMGWACFDCAKQFELHIEICIHTEWKYLDKSFNKLTKSTFWSLKKVIDNFVNFFKFRFFLIIFFKKLLEWFPDSSIKIKQNKNIWSNHWELKILFHSKRTKSRFVWILEQIQAKPKFLSSSSQYFDLKKMVYP